ncbi:hypothetical protein DRW07_15640 [Alteromonas sediminis]|uniref:MSHA biogenesis protein MshJ n=1 Tax=Alteromonas sediminis TaxID=2259342 RepID=A0A3N5XZ69_9ALTE|nr:type 4a pilus biogenesis protein PilO [Alteromonas sediminis]RPJ65336.1 hypothetical protein DRW07_15640 [Alteromonas sediminis]
MQAWDTYSDKFDALSGREKWLALLVGIVITIMVGFTYGIEPLMKDNTKLKTQISANQTQIKSLEMQLKIYQEALQVDPNAEYNAQLAQLKQRMSSLEQQFADELSELISPQAMPSLMNEVLSLSGALSLESMQSIQPVNIFADKPDMKDIALYQHGIQLTFTGSFAQIQSFLAELEATQWQVYWRTMQYDVDAYPEATLMIEFYTLSAEKELLRV